MGRWIDVVALGITQIIGYGTLYYSFSILSPAMARDFGWPNDWIFGALSVALLTGGLVAPKVGRWIDRFGAGRVMAIGSMFAALSLVACAAAPSGKAFVPALFAIEIAATLVQYGAAFALLVQRHGGSAQRSIVYLTLIAGFASTIFWPLTTWLHSFLTWQQVYLAFAVFHLALCLPIHLSLARPVSAPIEASHTETKRAQSQFHGSLTPKARGKGFLLMAIGFALQSFVSSAILVHMLPMLGALGLGLSGVAVGALFGPSQVASRFINMMFGKGLSQLNLAVISAALLPLALILLLLTAPSFAGAMLFAVLFGMGNGLYSIVGGTLPLALFGAEGYGTRQGQLMSVRLIAGSAAPFVFALMMEQIGITGTLSLIVVLGGGSICALLGIVQLTRNLAVEAGTGQATSD
ncbi:MULTISPECIES: arsenite efflux MFS transporter ArsK [unclassified Chelatococcus]|uniref:arsenite efflux MFS transporter ArsK n=1 Tax=unclassified Chelatococcus TaxID=2638111 RepID=UPI001BCB8C95|nr:MULTISPECIES: arsenite efflux MFS transporter ArsK [unclassified Chelatococcus]MBS7700389.1 arsenite efflux MFS transporter ArsK [Chelatococcus sp. YT9]MBX3556185.1 arsenite efflux MFS transporter ArsK [Chelatococcus sp.]